MAEYYLKEINQYYNEVRDWTLHGQLWVIYAEEDERLSDPGDPQSVYESVRGYYRHRIQKLNI
jgi:hypothetical protein